MGGSVTSMLFYAARGGGRELLCLPARRTRGSTSEEESESKAVTVASRSEFTAYAYAAEIPEDTSLDQMCLSPKMVTFPSSSILVRIPSSSLDPPLVSYNEKSRKTASRDSPQTRFIYLNHWQFC